MIRSSVGDTCSVGPPSDGESEAVDPHVRAPSPSGEQLAVPRSTTRRSGSGEQPAVPRSTTRSTRRRGSSKGQSISRFGTKEELWAENWGITTAEIRQLIEECRQTDPTWSRKTSIRTLVNEHVKPRTAGTGVGYALLVSPDCTREVEIMVSHSWNEPAEEFLEALERTVSKDDVLFICAFSIFQNEDGSGPSIAEQIGLVTTDSPFFVVLECIATRSRKAGWRMLHRFSMGLAQGWWLLGSVLALWMPFSILGRVCSFRGAMAWDKVAWSHDDEYDALCYAGLGCSLCMLGCAVLVYGLPWLTRPYRGRMVVVPNSEDDLYSRMWCVYEMFVAKRCGVRVQLAPTMASAGAMSCAHARCSWEPDELRIRREIEESCGGYETVDKAILGLLRPQWWYWLRFKGVASVVFVVGLVHHSSAWLIVAKSCVLAVWAFSCWWTATLRQGRLAYVDMMRLMSPLVTTWLAAVAVWLWSRSAWAQEMVHFAVGVAFLQLILCLAVRASYRARSLGLRHTLIAAAVAIFSCFSTDHSYLLRASWSHPAHSAVLVLDFVMRGPLLGVGFYWLDIQWGIQWTPAEVSTPSPARAAFTAGCLGRCRARQR